MRLDGKVCMITGGAGGLGTATARRYIAEGATVVIADIMVDAARDLAGQLGERATAMHLDCKDPESIRGSIEDTVARFGKLDVLFNNAAAIYLNDQDLGVVDTTMEVWNEIIQVNLTAVWLGCKYAVPHMVRNGGGAIINMSSNAAVSGDDVRMAYGATKAGVMSLTRSVATRHGSDNIRCNAILPGLIITDLIANHYPELVATMKRHVLVRHGKPADIAAMATFLASDDAEYITGQCYAVDGGLLSHMPQIQDMRDYMARMAQPV